MAAGEHFIYAGLEFIALEHTADGTVAVTANCVCDKPFDNRDSGNEAHNDWRTSTLKRWLNGEFLETLLQGGATETAFTPMLLDLTADDGLDDYGTDENKVGLLGVENYRKYRKLLPPIDAWWWLITPYSTKANGFSYDARSVNADGTLDLISAYSGSNGVRPLCTLQYSILVSVINAAEGEELEETNEDDAADQSAEQDTPPEWYADDIRTQKAIDGFYECIEVAQQRYKDGKEDFTGIISAMSLIKYLKGDLPF